MAGKPNPLPPTPIGPMTLADIRDPGLPHDEVGTQTSPSQ
jgi:hypothetical protein